MPEGNKMWVYWELAAAEVRSLFFVLDLDERYGRA